MSKNNNKPPKVEAPIVEKKEEKTPAKVDVLQLGDMEKLGKSYTKNGGLDANRRMDMLTGLRIMFHDDPVVAKNLGLTEETVNTINGITALGYAAALVDEVQFGPSGWAAKMRVSQLEQIKAVMPLLGVEVDTKALPAPDKEGNVTVTRDAIKVSKETKEKLAAEKKLNDDAKSGKKEYLTDLTKIETDAQLKEALEFQLTDKNNSRPVARLVTTAQFYRSHLEARAEKSNDPKAELAKIHEFTLADLLQDISTMVEPTFVSSGFGKMLCISAETSNCVVSAFNMFKRACFDKKLNKYEYSDEEIATFVRVLIVWYASSKIASLGKDLKALSKDAKANAKAIEGCNNAIKHFQGLIALTNDPDFSIIDALPDAYNNADNASHKNAEAIVKSVVETYYKGEEINDLNRPVIVLNAQQYAGVTLNLFRDPLTRRDDYTLEKLIAMPEKKEESQGEEESKNQ